MFLRRIGAFFLDLLEVGIFALSIFLFIYLLVVQPHKIKGASMEPNFPNGEFLLTDKITYRLREPKRGDVIVFKAPTENGEEFIKRIMAVPGETISVADGSVFVNGKKLDEYYLPEGLFTSIGQFMVNKDKIVVPEGEYFVMGDNRPFSSDSRSWGFVPKDKITGRAWFVYWPVSSMGTVKEVTYPNL